MRRKKLEIMKSNLSEIFDLPKDIMLNLPRISMIGNNQMMVENHKGIIEYTPQRIRVNSSIGVIRIQGKDMQLKNIASDDIMITGEIKILEYI
ncbi:MAG: sporulation protein YqfC [Clostridiales bacterium]|nr:sporulation protein YqfC [Clostridiales bacterium]